MANFKDVIKNIIKQNDVKLSSDKKLQFFENNTKVGEIDLSTLESKKSDFYNNDNAEEENLIR